MQLTVWQCDVHYQNEIWIGLGLVNFHWICFCILIWKLELIHNFGIFDLQEIKGDSFMIYQKVNPATPASSPMHNIPNFISNVKPPTGSPLTFIYSQKIHFLSKFLFCSVCVLFLLLLCFYSPLLVLGCKENKVFTFTKLNNKNSVLISCFHF